MPKTPKGHKRPADVIANAVHVMKIATGDTVEDDMEVAALTSQAAAVLGRKGGFARAAALTKAKKKRIAKVAASARWGKRKT